MKTNRTRSLGGRALTECGGGTSLRYRSVALLGALVIAGTLSTQAQAAAPSLMTYQGRLKESGLPVTGARIVEIAVCPDPILVAGCLATGQQNVSVTNGLFRTTFTASGWDPTVGPWYLEVRVGAAAVALAPREQLTSSPYALHASSAATLVASAGTAGVNISTNLFIVNASNVGIGTTNPTARLHIISAPSVQPLIVEANSAAERFRINTEGRIEVSGPTPTFGACAGGAFLAPSNDVVGKINFTVAGPASCVMNFVAPAWLNPPVCVASFKGAGPIEVDTTAISVTFTKSVAFAVGDIISYQCIGRR